jgi:beta-lactam-binding protein with PASTA domain
VTVPDVLGVSQQIAENRIEAEDLIANVETQDSDEPEGTIIAQDPLAGTETETDSEVTIVVSTGAGSVLVPDVEGLFRDGAIRIMQNAGLNVVWEDQETTNPADDGRVLDQAPEPGQRVPEGETVTLIIGEFTEIAAP